MKLRKHKNDKAYRITFQTRAPTKIYTVAEGKTARKVVEWGQLSTARVISATGHCIPSVLRAFMVGRDVGNTLAVVREARVA